MRTSILNYSRLPSVFALTLALSAGSAFAIGDGTFAWAWQEADRPAGAPGRVDAFTSPGEAMNPETISQLRAGMEVNLIVEYDDASLSVFADADAETIRQSRRRIKRKILEELRTLGIEEQRDYRELSLGVVRLNSLHALDALRHNPGVVAAHEIGRYSSQLAESLPIVAQPEAQVLGATGIGATVAVLDTGVDYSHPAFGACAEPGADVCRVVYAQDFAADDGARDEDGHGTNVAGIVLGVAPQAGIAALDVFEGRYAYEDDVLAALDWVLLNRDAYNIVAVNLSLGDDRRYTRPCNGSSLRPAFRALRAAGVAIAVAAGNEAYANGLASPACVPGATSVGAVYDARDTNRGLWGDCWDKRTHADKVACFSNSSEFLSVLAPGATIEAAGLPGAGTSQAAPHVAGAVAALKSACPEATTNDILDAIVESGTPITDEKNGITKPRLDLAEATRHMAFSCDKNR